MKLLHGLLSAVVLCSAPCMAEDVALAQPATPTETATGLPFNVDVTDVGNFEVVYHRVEGLSPAAPLFGLVGVMVDEGVGASKDQDKKQKILPMMTDASCGKPLADMLVAMLQKSGRYTLTDVDAKGSNSILIDVDECGLRLVDTSQMQLASFVTFELQYKPADGSPAMKEKIQVTGRNRHNFDQFVNQAGLAQAEMTDALARAGSRAANKIIYRK